ncbi:hypothetical protein EV426DRAFT_293453 [Tirmania nivea]|nr:hypothetical protein EV426DRAFT_293453 [Tirmania nivea]
MENIKSVSIFTSYFLAILACTFVIVTSILRPLGTRKWNGANRSTKHTLYSQLVLFVILSILSLSFTWYHMLRFFHLSYATWSTTVASPDTPRTIGYWLRDTKLFEEAYRIVVITPERWWWSQQIFLACFGWGIWISYQGHGRKLAAYMALAQLVSLSVAVNLYFVDVLAHRGAEAPSAPPADPKENVRKKPVATETRLEKALLGFYLTFCFIPTLVLPILIHTPPESQLNKLFFPALLLPHVALFIPIFFMCPVSPRFTRILYTCSSFGSVACHAASTLAVVKQVTVSLAKERALASGTSGAQTNFYEIIKTTIECLGGTLLNAHPAVSSVSWDVSWFVVSVALWAGIEGGGSGVWIGVSGDKVGQREGVSFMRMAMRVVVAAVMMAVGGAGVGALIFAADL